MRAVRSLALAVVAALLASCTLQTAGGPKGDRTLSTRFDDAQHLVIGHSVRISDIPVGTVTKVELDGYQALVEFSVLDDRPIPVGTVASISSTSLLGENYVRLVLPDEPTDSMHGDGDELPSSGADASLEELTIQLLALTRAVQGRDVATVVEAGAEALGGRGEALNGLLKSLDDLGDGLVAQRDDFAAVLDNLADIGVASVADVDEIGETIELLASATGTLAEQRSRIVTAVGDLTELAQTLDDEVLTPHRERLDQLLADLVPVAGVLADETDRVLSLLEHTRIAGVLLPQATGSGELLSYAIFDEFVVLDENIDGGGLHDLLQILMDPDPTDPVGTLEDILDTLPLGDLGLGAEAG